VRVSTVSDLRIRRYDPRDGAAVRRLHRRALRDAGTDPADVPGTEDLARVEATYVDAGGEFLVGVRPADGAPGSHDCAGPFRTHDGTVVSMGGYLPCEAGHADERTVEGAAELHRMRVAPAHQRAGHGRRLLAALERRARESGFERLLATTAVGQAGAVAFYREEGYAETGRSTAGDYELVHFEKRL
jgi:GNAT superfamily N-acetyltransferase